MCVFDVSSVEHRILLMKKYSGIVSGVVYFFVAFCPAVNFPRGILSGDIWSVAFRPFGILSRGIMSGIRLEQLRNPSLSQKFGLGQISSRMFQMPVQLQCVS